MLDFDERDMMPLTLEEYEAEALEFAIYDDDLVYPVLGLVSEAGEVADKFKKLLRDEQLALPLDDPAVQLQYEERFEIAKEISDVIWYATALANDLGFSLEEIAEINLNKLRDRSNRGAIQGSGDNR